MLKNSSWSLQGLNFSSPCLTIPKEGVVPFHEAGLVRTITLYLHNKKNLKNAYPWEEDQVGKEKKKKKEFLKLETSTQTFYLLELIVLLQ